ncbi:hypothetical protein, partial [Stomatobaculum longum]|uniref:hypothetical protein n=1 Tax=Stomatobaculum longum TaxID=796942 RepID=UPI002804CC79
SYFTRYYLVWFFFEILLEVCEHIRKMLANPLFSQRFQGYLYCLIFDFQGPFRLSRPSGATPLLYHFEFFLSTLFKKFFQGDSNGERGI